MFVALFRPCPSLFHYRCVQRHVLISRRSYPLFPPGNTSLTLNATPSRIKTKRASAGSNGPPGSIRCSGRNGIVPGRPLRSASSSEIACTPSPLTAWKRPCRRWRVSAFLKSGVRFSDKNARRKRSAFPKSGVRFSEKNARRVRFRPGSASVHIQRRPPARRWRGRRS